MVVVRRHKDIVKFCVGLMSDPTPLIRHIYGMLNEWKQGEMRYVEPPSVVDVELIKSLHSESRVELPDDFLTWSSQGNCMLHLTFSEILFRSTVCFG